MGNHLEKKALHSTKGHKVEMPQSLQPEAPLRKIQKWEEEFRCLDKDNDGFITMEELRKERSLGKAEFQQFIKHMDKDGDSMISREEFINSCCASRGWRSCSNSSLDMIRGA